MLKKKVWTNFQRIIEFFTQKIVNQLSKIWVWDPGSNPRSEIWDPGSGIRGPGSGKNLFRIPDPGVKKAPDPGSATRICIKEQCHKNFYSDFLVNQFLLHSWLSRGFRRIWFVRNFLGGHLLLHDKIILVSSNIVRNLMIYSYNFRSFPGVDEVAGVLTTAYHHLQCKCQKKLCVLVYFTRRKQPFATNQMFSFFWSPCRHLNQRLEGNRFIEHLKSAIL